MKLRYLSLLLALFLLCGCSNATPAPTENTSIEHSENNITKTPAPEQEETNLDTEPEPQIDPLVESISAMSDEALVGQLFLARYPGNSRALTAIAERHIGGFVLFGADLEYQTAKGIADELNMLQAASHIPLLIAVDEEGGSVTRVSTYPQYRETRFPSPRKLYDQGGLELVLSTEEEKCQLLRSLGINVNLAPVCDVTTDPGAFMYSRSLGQAPEITGQYIGAVVELMHSKGVGGVLKHFPGYGNNDDTHIGTALDNRSLEELESNDLIPFQAGIDAGCDAIMVTHTTIAALDATMPGSLSPSVMAYLRQDMGFDGVIMTDDLAMGAITDVYGAGEAAVLAVLAGNDVLCCSEYEIQYDAVLQALQEGRLTRERLEESVYRILLWKQDLGLI